ncbi:hypothetical protein [Effusibacillus consociatus]|uniref:Uncharacterized protein n=1 Tax=Effusibacillus consociatus TaxID=1117041 RepID=A0ABV9Q2A4_9BACL
MFEKIILLLIIYSAILIYDGRKWKLKGRRERLSYGAITLTAVYLSFIYVTDSKWPNLNHIIEFFFADPAKHIVESVKLPS